MKSVTHPNWGGLGGSWATLGRVQEALGGLERLWYALGRFGNVFLGWPGEVLESLGAAWVDPGVSETDSERPWGDLGGSGVL